MSEKMGEAALRWQALAARALGWRPDDFWNATPAELAACLTPRESAAAPLGRGDLDRLMEQNR